MTAWPLKQTQCLTGKAVTAVQADCRGSLGHILKEGKCCRNCLPEYLTLQLCTQLNTQISE